MGLRSSSCEAPTGIGHSEGCNVEASEWPNSQNDYVGGKGVPGKNLLPGVGKFFLTSKLDPPPPSPAIYSNIARGLSFLRHHATKGTMSLALPSLRRTSLDSE